MPAFSSTAPTFAIPCRSSSRTAAARLGMRWRNLKLSTASSSLGESMICSRSSRARPLPPSLFRITKPPQIRQGRLSTRVLQARLSRRVGHLLICVKSPTRQKPFAALIPRSLLLRMRCPFEPALSDTRGATGRLMLNMFAAMAQFEREMMLERQREGIAKAKAEGKYKGRKPTARAKAQDALRLFREGKKVAHIAKELGIGRGSVYRALADTATM